MRRAAREKLEALGYVAGGVDRRRCREGFEGRGTQRRDAMTEGRRESRRSFLRLAGGAGVHEYGAMAQFTPRS